MFRKKKKKIVLHWCPHCKEDVTPDDFYCKNCKVIIEDYRNGRIPYHE